jgi:hypothetical protein
MGTNNGMDTEAREYILCSPPKAIRTRSTLQVQYNTSTTVHSLYTHPHPIDTAGTVQH